MTTALKDMQFELLPNIDADEGVVFGIGADVSMNDEGFDPGEDSWSGEDEMNPRRGGTSFGRELLEGPTWGFDLHVNRDNAKHAIETLARIKTAWRALHIRDTPGAIIPLRYQLDGRARRTYGRPRRFAAPPNNKILSGYVPITADFACVDGFTYDDVEQVLVLALQEGSEGGFILPAIFPHTTQPVGLAAQQAVVGGDAPAYPVIRFNGPVTNPSLETDDWILTLSTNIPAGQYVEVDLRPWAITVLLNGSSSLRGALGRRTYLADMTLQPGVHSLLFRGSDVSNSATCAVRWANTHNSI